MIVADTKEMRYRMSDSEKRRKDRKELHELLHAIEHAKNEDIAKRAISIADYYLLKTENQAKHIQDLEARNYKTRTGKWVLMSDADGDYYCCSECGEELYRKWSFDREFDLSPKKESIDRTNFCPECGARMEE